MLGMAAILLLLGLAFLAAEAILPLHGTSIIGGLAAIAIAVAMFFSRSVWAGLGATAGSLLAFPIIWLWVVWIWPYTPIGKRVVLGPVKVEKSEPGVCVGMKGVALTELKPAGICEFGGVRLSATSELGWLRPGTKVRVVAINDMRATVQAEESGA
jgi:membrane-bound ClpP family serine protease